MLWNHRSGSLAFLGLNFVISAAAAAKSLQSCPTLCSPRDGSPPGSPVPRILQARTLEWVAISFSNAWKWKGKVKLLSCVWLLATPWTAAFQAPPSMGFARKEYWSGVPLKGVKNLPTNARYIRNAGLIPGKIPWRRNWQPIWYSCLENPIDRGPGKPQFRGLQNCTWLKQFITHAHTHGTKIVCVTHTAKKKKKKLQCMGLGSSKTSSPCILVLLLLAGPKAGPKLEK